MDRETVDPPSKPIPFKLAATVEALLTVALIDARPFKVPEMDEFDATVAEIAALPTK
jgi:hypothetical protein